MENLNQSTKEVHILFTMGTNLNLLKNMFKQMFGLIKSQMMLYYSSLKGYIVTRTYRLISTQNK